MFSISNKNFINEIKENLGHKTFLLGTIFLPSAFPIGALLLLTALFCTFLDKKINFIRDRWNYILLISLGLILASSINSSILNTPVELLKYNKSLIWINLFNWIPCLLGFLGFQRYLRTTSQKITFIKALLIGTVPIIYSAIMQYFFKQYGPYETLNGLVIWFQKPLLNGRGVSGLFNNPNYLATWLSITLPFSFLIIKVSKRIQIKLIALIFSSLIILFLMLTYSRNAFLSFLLISICFFGLKKVFISILPAGLFFLISNSLEIGKEFSTSFFNWIISNNLFDKILNNTFNFQSNLRVEIWESAISFINKKPIFGWGASTFPYLNLNYNESFSPPLNFIAAQHSHNIALEIAHNFGLPLSLIIICSIVVIFIKFFNKLKKTSDSIEYITNRSWLISSLIIFLIHMTDITYYDGKIGLIICILFAGLRSYLPYPRKIPPNSNI